MSRYNILNGQPLYPTIQTLYMTICLPLNWFSVTPATRYLSLTWRQPCEYGKHSSQNPIQLTSVWDLNEKVITTNCWCLTMKSLDRLGKILYNKLQIKLPGVDKRNFTHNYYVKNMLWFHAKFVVLFINNITFFKSGRCLGSNIKYIIILASDFLEACSEFSLWYTSCISALILQL